MTVDQLIEWIESAKRQSPKRNIGGYRVVVEGAWLESEGINLDVAADEIEFRV